MKYVFAGILVLLALIVVFHPEKAISVPRTVAAVITGSVAKHLPYDVKVEYANQCVEGLKGDRDEVRYRVADTAVNLNDLQRRIADLQEKRAKGLRRLQCLVAAGDRIPKDQVAREVNRFIQIEAQLAANQGLLDRMSVTLKSLEHAEVQVTEKVGQVHDRLEMVKLDHMHNNARELAAKLTDPDYPGYRSLGTHCAEVIGGMEHDEKVREDLYLRFGPVDEASLEPEADPVEQAKQILSRGA